MKRVFDEGGAGFIALYTDLPIGFGWISFKVNPELIRIPVPLQLGDAYLHALFIATDKRNLGCGRELVMRRLHYIKEKGYKRVIITVLKSNAPSLRVQEILGYDYIGEIVHTRILFWDFYRYI